MQLPVMGRADVTIRPTGNGKRYRRATSSKSGPPSCDRSRKRELFDMTPTPAEFNSWRKHVAYCQYLIYPLGGPQ